MSGTGALVGVRRPLKILILISAATLASACGSARVSRSAVEHSHPSNVCTSNDPSCLHVNHPNRLNGSDRRFLARIIGANQQAIGITSLAQAKASQPATRTLASEILADDRSQLPRFEALARRFHMLPAPVKPVRLPGAMSFDSAFLATMIAHDQEALSRARAEITNGYNFDVESVASTIVAVDSGQLQQLQALKAKLSR